MKAHKYSLIFFSLILLIFSACYDEPKYDYVVEQMEAGYMECFPSKTLNDDNTPVSCELSGIAYYHDSVFFVSDKRIPGTTSFFGGPFQVPFRRKDFTHYGEEYIMNARKLEDMAVSPRQKYMFVITGFDRIDAQPSDNDYYNMLIVRNLNYAGEALAFPETRAGRKSSLRLRRMIKEALKTRLFPRGFPYFKVGGIAVTDDNYFLIGIREFGKSHREGEHESTITILGAKYKIEENNLIFTSELKVLYRFKPNNHYLIEHEVGLSGLEYDVFNKRLLILTSFKKGLSDEGLGGYMWVLPIMDFKLQNPPSIVRNKDGTPFKFAHKCEGVTILDPVKALVIHDDDRITGSDFVVDARSQFKRELNEAAYTILYFLN